MQHLPNQAQALARLLSALLLLALTAHEGSAVEPLPIFETDIGPLLARKCGSCHGDNIQKASLNLATMTSIRAGGESGEPLIGESIDDSYLWNLIEADEMPPADQPQLTAQEKSTIHDWLAAGAPAQEPVDDDVAPHQHDVLPIVLLRCATCHGRQRQDGGLDMRTVESMQRGGKSGPAFVAGEPDNSLMIQRIESEACPPRDLLLKFFVRRPGSAEVDKLKQWIAADAPLQNILPDVATVEGDRLVTDDDRQHWAFQPPTEPTEFQAIDEFVAARLATIGLTLAESADRDTLIRRAYMDLLGMPPSVEDWARLRRSSNPDWYRQMIDELLASHHYGERWGRYWLDVAGYADSEGGVSADPVRKVAWKYRDYVIQSFNEDKSYDQFLTEQIAGDELIDYEQAKVVTQEMVDNLIATGFLRMGIDQTGSRTMNFVPERLGVIGDAISVLGSGVMGLTLECARCHSHKYDPIPHRDYYRFKAILQGAMDEHDWLTFKNRSLTVATDEHRRRVSNTNPPLTKRLRKLQAAHKQSIADQQLETLKQHYPDQSEADRQATLRALKIADNNRSQVQRLLVEKLQVAESIGHDQQPPQVLEARRRVALLADQIIAVQRQLEPALTIRALWDRGQPSPTYILRRGEHDKPGKLVGPGVPSVLTDGKTPLIAAPPFKGKTGRRLALAKWLTQPDHPLTSRVMINRIWYHHFGTGIVGTLENFGVQGDKPSHPALLDWLANEFVRRNWSIKEMHRLIMNSRTYRQSSRIRAQQLQLDPQNRFLSRMPLRRLDAEALRDSLLFVSGQLDDTPGGPPDPIAVDREGFVSIRVTAGGGWRRSVYAQYRRTEIPTMMDTFDYPNMGPNCVSRTVSTVSPQSLMLMNNGQIYDLAKRLADRVRQKAEHADDYGSLVDTVYRIALSRAPSSTERQVGVDSLQRLRGAWDDDLSAALATYCHTILNSAAFLYVD